METIMAKFKEKQRAIELRLEGKSYTQIRKIVPVSKSTLSYWLKDYPLTEEKLRALRDWNATRIEHYRETRRRQREQLLAKAYEAAKRQILPISKREIFLCGLFLYWGEGSKTKVAELSVSNTDPSVIKFFIYWLEHCLGIPKAKIRIKLHLYQDMDIAAENHFWSHNLSVRQTQFKKPYIKRSSHASLTYKNKFGHGTCNASISGAMLNKKVIASLNVIKDYIESVYQ
jgi:hypothetical protein